METKNEMVCACGSSAFRKAGLQPQRTGRKQRWLCKVCGRIVLTKE